LSIRASHDIGNQFVRTVNIKKFTPRTHDCSYHGVEKTKIHFFNSGHGKKVW